MLFQFSPILGKKLKLLTVLAEEAVWEAELACACLLIPAAVPGEHLVMSGGLGAPLLHHYMSVEMSPGGTLFRRQ